MAPVSEAQELFRRGDARGAASLCEQILRKSPADPDALALLAQTCAALGNPAGAVECHERLTQLLPGDAAAWRRLGESELACKHYREAAAALRTALRLDPHNRRSHNNLGQALLRSGDVRGAIGCFEAALAVDSDYALGHYNLGVALATDGDTIRALQSLQQALTLQPDLVAAYGAMAALHVQRGAWGEALASCEQALRFSPDDVELQVQRASILLSQERAAEALAVADAVLCGRQGPAELHNIRGGALRRLGRHVEALAALDRAVSIDPAYAQAWSNRGMVLHELGASEAAVASYRRSIALDPVAILPRTRLLARLIPAVPASEDEAVAARRSFEAELGEFGAWLGTRALAEADALLVAEQQFFYLSYEERSSLPLLLRYRSAAAARLAGLSPSLALSPVAGRASESRLRVGFVSAHVHDHSVYNAMLRGWLLCLEKRRFEIILFSLGTTVDAATHEAAAAADRYVTGARHTADWARAIGGAGCAVLVYPELGMNSQCLALAALRLAPRQFAAWGHPETSGLPTVDGFLSADAFEPPQAERHYSERLWRLPRLGVHCSPYGLIPVPPDLRALGLEGAGPLLLCPGLPQKYRPRDDSVLAQIALRLGRCRFVFFEGSVPQQSRRLVTRIGSAFVQVGLDPTAFIALLPWQSRADFFGLMQRADVYLDTLGFSGFNTLIQAVECGLPCVALEGAFMRGRLGSGILRTMDLGELVAADRPGYVDIAVRLASSPEYRTAIRRQIEEGRHVLWEDSGTVEALAQILDSGAPLPRQT